MLVRGLLLAGGIVASDLSESGPWPVVRTPDERALVMNERAYLVGEVLAIRAVEPTDGLAVVVARLGRRFGHEDLGVVDRAIKHGIDAQLERIADHEPPCRQQHGLYVVSSESGRYDSQVLAAHVSQCDQVITITRSIGQLEGPLAREVALALSPRDEVHYRRDVPGELLVVEVIGHGYPG